MNILIVDDQTMLRSGMKLFLENISSEYKLFQAATLDEAGSILQKEHIQLVISEISINGEVGPALVGRFRSIRPELSVLFYSAFSEKLYALSLMRAGANGFISKRSKIKEFARAICTVSSGGKYMSVELQASLLPHINTGQQISDLESPTQLSQRESTIMSQVIQGKSTKEIAFTLKLKSNTISTYKKRIYRKMNVADNFELFQKAIVVWPTPRLETR